MGHQKLITLGKNKATDAQQELLVMTFYPQMQAVFDQTFKYLITQAEKNAHFQALGVDRVLALAFEKKLAQTSPEDFVEKILLDYLQAKHIIVGFNYTFGYKGAGNAELLAELAQKHQVSVHIVSPVYCDKQLINSSSIRQFLKQGQIEKANAFLGYNFSLKGEVIHGHKVGRTIGIPTANLKLGNDLLLPKNGVYAAKVTVGKEEKLGVLNIGMRPTVDNGNDTSVEVHILDFDREIYGEIISVTLHHYLRGESKFNSLAELKAQIQQDMTRIRKILK